MREFLGRMNAPPESTSQHVLQHGPGSSFEPWSKPSLIDLVLGMHAAHQASLILFCEFENIFGLLVPTYKARLSCASLYNSRALRLLILLLLISSRICCARATGSFVESDKQRGLFGFQMSYICETHCSVESTNALYNIVIY